MRKLLCLMVITAMLIAMFVSPVSAATPSAKFVNADLKSNQFFVKKGEEFLSKMLSNIDGNTVYKVDQYLDDATEKYYVGKKEIQDHVCDLYHTDKINYSTKINSKSIKINSDHVFLSYQVDAKFNYANTPEIDSGYGRVYDMMLDKKSGEIVDVYEQDSEFDEVLKGDDYSVVEYDQNDMISIKEIDVTVSELTKCIDNEYREIMNPVNLRLDTLKNGLMKSASTLKATAASTGIDLNRNKIAEYARQNMKENPASGGAGVAYYDFSQLSEQFDCTNYVSHALLAGGAKPYDTGSEASGWHCKGSNKSHSWAGVSALNSFLKTNRTKGPGGTEHPYTTGAVIDWKIGEVLQHKHTNGSWAHSTIITGISISGGVTNAVVCGRSKKGQYNNNLIASDVVSATGEKVVITNLKNYS